MVIRPAPIASDLRGDNGWQALLDAPPPVVRLTGEKRCRTAVIGAGICGLSTARRLGELCPDDDIVLVDAARVGDGASGQNAGFLFNMHTHGLVKRHDVLERNAKLWNAGLADLRRIVSEHQIQCDWSDWGRLYGSAGPDGERHVDFLAETLDALGLPYERRDHEQMRADLGTDFYLRGLHVPGNAMVNPAAMVRGLARALPTNVSLFEETPVVALNGEAAGCRLKTPEGEIVADRIVVTAGVFMRRFGIARGRYVPLALFAILTEPLSAKRRSQMKAGAEFGLLPTAANGATVRLTRDGRIFMRNISRYAPDGPPREAMAQAMSLQLEQALAKRWPEFDDLKIAHRWGGAMAFTGNDGAIFGETAPGIFALLSNDVSPMTRGAAAGRLLAEHMEGIDSDLLAIQMSYPEASRLPPRPFLDLGVAWKLRKVRQAGAGEF